LNRGNYSIQNLLFAILLCSCVSATAQAPPSTAVPNKPPGLGRGVVTRQPPALGDNISQLIDRLILAGGMKGKDEFETTEQYDARRNEGKVATAKQGTLVFVLSPDTFDVTYSADAQEMTIKMTARQRSLLFDGGGSTSGNTFIVRSTLISKSSYVGTNSFGVKRSIESTVSRDHGVFVAQGSTMTLNEISNAASFTFSMDIEEARVSKRFLRVALVGRLAEWRVYSSEDGHSPTVEEPWDSLTKGSYIPFLLEEVRVLDSRTGQVVSNFTPGMKVGN
jgi:hypothetical protein